MVNCFLVLSLTMIKTLPLGQRLSENWFVSTSSLLSVTLLRLLNKSSCLERGWCKKSLAWGSSEHHFSTITMQGPTIVHWPRISVGSFNTYLQWSVGIFMQVLEHVRSEWSIFTAPLAEHFVPVMDMVRQKHDEIFQIQLKDSTVHRACQGSVLVITLLVSVHHAAIILAVVMPVWARRTTVGFFVLIIKATRFISPVVLSSHHSLILSCGLWRIMKLLHPLLADIFDQWVLSYFLLSLLQYVFGLVRICFVSHITGDNHSTSCVSSAPVPPIQCN